MNAKHTPGPWKIERSIPEEGFECFFITTEYWPNSSICDCPGPHIKEKESNALLIAAAPDMLEALKIVAGEISDHIRPTSADSHLPTDIKSVVFAAIAKATGDQ